MVLVSFKPVADLNAIAEGIVAVDGVAALLVPRNLGRIRSPVVFLAVEFFQDRRIDRGVDAKIDMGSLDRSRATLRDLLDAAQNYQLARVGYGQRNLLIARHLPFFR